VPNHAELYQVGFCRSADLTSKDVCNSMLIAKVFMLRLHYFNILARQFSRST
jgi:hypothetical protein